MTSPILVFYDETCGDFPDLNASVLKQTNKERYADALQVAEDSQRTFKAKADAKGQAAAARVSVWLNAVMGNEVEALSKAEEAKSLSQKSKDESGVAASLHMTAKAYYLCEKYEDSLKAAQEALTKYKSLKFDKGQASTLTTIARVHLVQGLDKDATDEATEAASLAKGAGDKMAEFLATYVLVDTNVGKSKPKKALQFAQSMESLADSMNNTLAACVKILERRSI